MSDSQRKARLDQIQDTLNALQREVHDIALDLIASGKDGEAIMADAGFQLVAATEAVALAKTAA